MLPPANITAAAAALRQRKYSVRDLTEHFLQTIERLESQIRAWVIVDRQAALRQADSLDQEAAADRWRGPLHGIPLGVKDIIDVRGYPTKAGSALRNGAAAALQDAPAVACLRENGAVILGKTVTTEFACFDPPPTVNPLNVERTPGGSSSGSAAAVAAKMCMAALGSQTGGSITRPASYCGIAGFKGEIGATCRAGEQDVDMREGVVPVSLHLDHVGPLAGDVQGLAWMWKGMQGRFPEGEYAALPEIDAPRLGWIETYFWEQADDPMRRVCDRALETLRQAGAELQRIEPPKSFAQVHAMHRRLMVADAFAYHRDDWLNRPEMFAPGVASLLAEGSEVAVEDYRRAMEHQQVFSAEMKAVVRGFDAVLTPAAMTAAPGRETTGDPRLNAPWSYCGIPTATSPGGVAEEGMPCGLQWAGVDSQGLLAAARWCEKALEPELQRLRFL